MVAAVEKKSGNVDSSLGITLSSRQGRAVVAQLVEQLIRNQQVVRSNRINGSTSFPRENTSKRLFFIRFLGIKDP